MRFEVVGNGIDYFVFGHKVALPAVEQFGVHCLFTSLWTDFYPGIRILKTSSPAVPDGIQFFPVPIRVSGIHASGPRRGLPFLLDLNDRATHLADVLEVLREADGFGAMSCEQN
jgi:hypothetical protein